MLKNKKLVKIVVSMLLSVTLVCAMCFQAYAEDRMRYYPEEDTVNNMYYCGIVWSSIDADDGIVYAVNASTLVAPNIEGEAVTYTSVVVEAIVEVYRGSDIFVESVVDYLNFEEIPEGTVITTEWIVPDVTNPFDYVITYHRVYLAESLEAWEQDQCRSESERQCRVIWEQMPVLGYNDLLYD